MHLHAVVRGRVQGVGFRWFVREAAHRLSLAGWVRNLADGSVEIAADGDEESIAAFRASISKGPAGASVSQVDELAPHPQPLERPFVIQR